MTDPSAASRVVVSFPSSLSDWGRYQIRTDRFKRFVGKTVDEAFVGKEFEEFVDVGCCGNTLDIPFRVEAVEGGRVVTGETAIEFVQREGEMAGGWRVQSAAGPGDG